MSVSILSRLISELTDSEPELELVSSCKKSRLSQNAVELFWSQTIDSSLGKISGLLSSQIVDTSFDTLSRALANNWSSSSGE